MKVWKVNQMFVESGTATAYVETLNFLGVGAILEDNEIRFDYDRAANLPKFYQHYNALMDWNYKTMMRQAV